MDDWMNGLKQTLEKGTTKIPTGEKSDGNVVGGSGQSEKSPLNSASVKKLEVFTANSDSRQLKEQFLAAYDEKIIAPFIEGVQNMKLPVYDVERQRWAQVGIAVGLRQHLEAFNGALLKQMIVKIGNVRELIIRETHEFMRGDFTLIDLADKVQRMVRGMG